MKAFLSDPSVDVHAILHCDGTDCKSLLKEKAMQEARRILETTEISMDCANPETIAQSARYALAGALADFVAD